MPPDVARARQSSTERDAHRMPSGHGDNTDSHRVPYRGSAALEAGPAGVGASPLSARGQQDVSHPSTYPSDFQTRNLEAR